MSKTLFLDIDTFPREDFKSGLLLFMKELLNLFAARGAEVGIASVAGTDATVLDSHTHKRTRVVQGIHSTEQLVKYDLHKEEFDLTRKLTQELLHDTKPNLILMNTPAVFLSEAHKIVLEEALATGARVIMIIFDSLFSKPGDLPASLIENYYNLFDRIDLYSISEFYIKKFRETVGRQASFLPTIIETDRVIAPNRNPQYITMINTHPIKGYVVFDRVAELLPSHKFRIIENWPDVPPYTPKTPNVTFCRFNEDIKSLYTTTSILLVPSLWEEGAARVVVEALLNGIPVIAHDIGALSEVGLGQVLFVDPPNILRTTLKGTILTPELEPDSFEHACTRVAALINSLDQHTNHLVFDPDKAKQISSNYCKQAVCMLESMIDSWLQL